MVADDHPIIRAGVNALLHGTDIEVVCEADSCEQTIRFALTCDPDVVLLDIRLADGDGLAALQEIKRERPSTVVLVFTASDDLKDMAQARRLGADGYMLKGLPRDQMLQTIRRASAGRKAWSIPQIRRVTSPAAAKAADECDRFPLSQRETQVLLKIIDGASNETIAEDLGIDIVTVKQHVKRLLKKIRVQDRTQAALWGLRNGINDRASD